MTHENPRADSWEWLRLYRGGLNLAIKALREDTFHLGHRASESFTWPMDIPEVAVIINAADESDG